MAGVRQPGNRAYALRGTAFVFLGIVAAVLMVLRGTGGLDRDASVSVDLPAEVGLITGEAPVRYAGVNVGRIAAIEPGMSTSTVRLAIGRDFVDVIPGDVIARVVPRTFFGDIYIQLIPAGAGNETPLADGDRIGADTGPDAVALYDIYTRMFDILDRMQPQQAQSALTTIGRALDGRGERIGRSIDHWTSASQALSPAVQDMLAGSPDLVTVLQAIDTATPELLDTLESATSLSRTLVDNSESFAAAVESAAGFAPVINAFLQNNRQSLTTVVNSSGEILATMAANPGGITRSIDEAQVFGASASVVFASGRFDITAVPSFADPLPYGPADCPRYGNLSGPYCGSASGSAPQRASPLAAGAVDTADGAPGAGGEPETDGADATASGTVTGGAPEIVGGAAEAPVLDLLEQHLGIDIPASGGTDGPDPASTVMLGPLVRGNEVTIR